MKRKIFQTVSVILACIICLSACGGGAGTASASADKENRSSGTKDKAVKVSVICTGDIMAHSVNIKSALQSDGTYDFTDNYEYVKKYISQADLALCNVETTFGGGTPSGYPMFNAPDELADAIDDAGFDVAITSNNHMMDSGSSGVSRTLKVLQSAGLDTVGSRASESDKGYIVENVKGARIGVVAYTYETTGASGTPVTINGNTVTDSTSKLINSFNYNKLDSGDYDKIKKDIDGCRKDGADAVICYMHWGTEYQRQENEYQKEMAQKLADMGADVIFASHPHVTQNIEILTSSDGKSVPVFYSMGNFISNQRQETLGNRYTEEGMIAEAKLTIIPGQGGIRAESINIIPVWVDRYTENGGTKYKIIPLDSHLGSNGALAMSGHMSRAQQAESDMESAYGKYIKGVTVFTSGGKSDDSSAAA